MPNAAPVQAPYATPYSTPQYDVTPTPGTLAPTSASASVPVSNKRAERRESSGATIAKLVLVLVAAIPLSAIGGWAGGRIGFIIAWIGIVIVAGFALLPSRTHRG